MEHEIAVQPFLTRWQSRLGELGFAVLVAAFAVFTIGWGIAYRNVFLSSEEHATFLFAEQYKNFSSLTIAAPSGLILPDGVHPRGMLRAGQYLLPPGVSVYPLSLGLIAKVTGNWFTPALTPILAVLGVFSFVGLLRPFVGRRIAMMSGALVLVHPAFIMYTLRGYYGDVAFLSIALIAMGLFGRILMLPRKNMPSDGNVELQIPWYLELGKKRHLLSAVFGLTFGLAMVMRPIQIVWLALLFVVLFTVLHSRLRPFSFIFAVSGALLILIPAGYIHYLYYGNVLPQVYQVFFDTMTPNLFVSPHFLRDVFEFFFIRQVWWMSVLLVCGLIHLARRGVINKMRSRLMVIAGLAGLTGVWVLWYYGSTLGIEGVGTTPSLSSPLARHFLPFYIMATPLAAAFVFSLRRSGLNRTWIAIAAVVMIAASLQSVFWGTAGLSESIAAYRKTYDLHDELVAMIPAQAVLVARTADTVIFPDREVLVHTRSESEAKTLGELRKNRIAVWFLDESGMASLENSERTWLRDAGFTPRRRATIKTVVLYELSPIY